MVNTRAGFIAKIDDKRPEMHSAAPYSGRPKLAQHQDFTPAERMSVLSAKRSLGLCAANDRFPPFLRVPPQAWLNSSAGGESPRGCRGTRVWLASCIFS